MQVRILGSAAGGGFPQWNCSCGNCARIRVGDSALRTRTQSSIAVSGDGEGWVLINASPDVRQQLNDFPGFHSTDSPRSTALAAVMLVDSQIDHAAGLLLLRESDSPLTLYTTERVRTDLASGFPVIDMLDHYCGVDWRPIPLNDESFTVAGLNGLDFTAVPLASKAPPYSPHRAAPAPGDNIGLSIRDTRTGRRLFYAPGLGAMEPHLRPHMASADCLLMDGTAWHDDELARQGVGAKRARDMGHLPLYGPGGMLEVLAPFGGRKILVHINNTNPILNRRSTERELLNEQGVEVGHDGMHLIL